MITMLLVRPYVFVFLLAFMVLAIHRKGLKVSLFFLVSGYLIALASEASSIRNGFPYGWYFYLYENMPGEPMVFGVPVWDSLSYSFLCFAGLSLEEERKPIMTSIWHRVGMSALWVMILDMVIDPVAHLGDQWFLGKIYYYEDPGFFFDVPMSNFLGWFGVAFAIILCNVLVYENLCKLLKYKRNILDIWGVPLFYFGIALFNMAITLYLKQFLLLAAQILLVAFPLFLFYRGRARQ